MENTITVDIQPQLEEDFKEIVQESYNGDESVERSEQEGVEM